VGVEHTGAHGALADAEMTLRVLERQLERYDDLPRDVAALSEWCFPSHPNAVDFEGKLRWNAQGELELAFGRYQGRTLHDLAQHDDGRRYLEWILRQEFSPEVKKYAQDALEGRLSRRSSVG